MSATADTAASRGLASCHVCCKLSAVGEAHCPRCGAALHLRNSNSLQRTLALLITASVLYIPANLYPIMITDTFAGEEISTIIGGVILLIDLGSVPIAMVILIASVMVPIGKLIAMYYLVWSVTNSSRENYRQRTKIYLVAEFIGKWSMVDVFVVAILAALVQLTGLLVIKPGIAAYSFAGVVLVTMVAAQNFDPRLMWDQLGEDDASSEA